MNDWIDAEGPLHVPQVLKVTLTDERTGEVKSLPQRRHLHYFGENHSMMVGFFGKQTQIRISGSPASFLSGQNAVGPNSVLKLTLRCFDHVCAKLKVKPTVGERRMWRRGDIKLRRVDITGYIVFDSHGRRNAVLRWLCSALGGRPDGNADRKGDKSIGYKLGSGTLVRGYAKEKRLSTRGRALANQDGGRLMRFLRRSIRAEVSLSEPDLIELGLNTAKAWRGVRVGRLIRSFMAKLPISMRKLGAVGAQQGTKEANALGLVRRWKSGEDVLSGCSPATRTRRIRVVKNLGVDFRMPYRLWRKRRKAAEAMSEVRLVTRLPKYLKASPLLRPLVVSAHRLSRE